MTRPLWTSEEAAKTTGGKAVGQWEVNGVSIDSRSVAEGDLFVALQDVRDGHDFVPNAYEAGAGACLVSQDVASVPALIVDDTLDGLEKLGLAARARTYAFCCAVTGSVGKTSVKEMVAQIFRAFGPAHWNVRSFNNHWGVPLTLARMPANTTRAIFEIGMNSPGEIEPRSKMVRPHAALITKIAPAHLEGMGSEDAVALEKSAIFAGLINDGTIILPAQDAYFEYLKDKAFGYAGKGKLLTFGGEQSDAFVTGSASDGLTSTFHLSVRGEPVSVTVNAVGDHWGENISAALLLALSSGISPANAANALNGYTPPEGRGGAEWITLENGGKALLVDDAYNANPESMRAALASFAQRPAKRRLIALGEMKELGAGADALHVDLSTPISACNPTNLFLAGEGIRPLESAMTGKTEVNWSETAKGLQEIVKKVLTDGDALLIKGSNASGMRLLADELRAWSKENAERVSGEGNG